MQARNWGQSRRRRILGIALAILSLVQTPLPQPDFHNIRHHDAPGEVCEDHDHLLRWHPNARLADDVAVLHWHWYLPSGSTDEAGHDGQGPGIHAHRPWWPSSAWDEGPRITVDTASQVSSHLAQSPLDLVASLSPPGWMSDAPAALARSHCGPGATLARPESLTALLQRWTC